jgi:uncharacterized membrane protein
LAKNKGALLAAVLLLAAFLRFYQLGTDSLWNDEGVSLRFANMEEIRIVKQSEDDFNYPTYYLGLHYWVALFGDSDFSLRVPSALAGLLAVFAMYKVGSLLFGRATGIMASLILALSPFHIQYSQEARVYNFMSLLALLSFYFFIKVLNERKLATQTGYVLSTSVLMYSHIYGLFIVLAQNIYVATNFLGRVLRLRHGSRPGLVEWVGLQALLFVLFIPGLVLLVGWLSIPGRHEWISSPSLDWIYNRVLVEYSGSPLLLIVLLAFSLLAAIALVRSGDASKLYLLLCWLLTPVALPLAISSFSDPIFSPRYGIPASLALYLLAAKGVEAASGAFSRTSTRWVPWVSKARTVWLIAATILIVLFCKELYIYFNNLDKPQWREVAQYVDTQAQTDDLVLLEGRRVDEELFDRYSKRTDLETERAQSLGATEAEGSSVEARDSVWVVSRRPPISRSDLRLAEGFFEDTHTLVDQEQYKDLDVTLYERN